MLVSRKVWLPDATATAVITRQLAAAFFFQGFGILDGIGQQRPMRDAKLVEQLRAAWALRGEVDVRVREGRRRHAAIVHARAARRGPLFAVVGMPFEQRP